MNIALEELGYIWENDNKPKMKIKRVNDFLYEMTVEKLYPAFAEESFRNRYMPDGACSSIRHANFHARNYDWAYDDSIEFIVKTTATESRHASIGVAASTGLLTRKIVESKVYHENYKIVPFRMMDGINDAGVVINTNVVPTDVFPRTTGTNPKGNDLSAARLTRFVLDNADSVDDAIAKLKTQNIWCPMSETFNQEFHWMISDATKTVVLELINNKLKVLDENIMTNFFLTGFDKTEKKLPKNPEGIERYNILRDYQSTITDVESALYVMSKVWYSKAYDLSMDPFWKSEFPGVTKEQLVMLAELFKNRKRSGNKVDLWQTVHTSVYDLYKGTLTVVNQEDINNKYTYNIWEMKMKKENNHEDLMSRLNSLEDVWNGGKGSGNFGHAGRPGLVGGSSPKGGKGGSAVKGKGDKKDTKSADEKTWERNNIGAGGVPGDTLPDRVPDQACPDKDAEAVYEKYAEYYNDPEKRKEAIEYLLNTAYSGKVIEVDGAKAALTERNSYDEATLKALKEKASAALKKGKGETLTEAESKALSDYYSYVSKIYKSGWGSDEEYAALKAMAGTGDKEAVRKFSECQEFRQKYNTAVHGTAVCLAKASLETKVSNMRANGEKIDIFMTAGGCASGKGFGMEVCQRVEAGTAGKLKLTGDETLVKNYKDAVKKATIVWDAAGDQCNSEIKYLKGLADNLTVSMTSNVDPNSVATGKEKGLVSRAKQKGRMVDVNVYVDSYNKGAENLRTAQKLWGNEITFLAYDSSVQDICRIIDAKEADLLKADEKAIRADIATKLSDINYVTDPKVALSGREIGAISYGANFTLNSK